MVALVLVAFSGVVVVACVQHARTQGWTAPVLNWTRGTAPDLPPPPADDRPPANLTPLIPSQRALAREFERGLRDLTFFLAVQPRD